MKSRPFNSFAIFGAMRSGSNLLEKYINQYQDLICHGEIFNPGLIRRAAREDYLGVFRQERLDHPERMLAAILKATPDKIPGFRIFQAHDARMISHALKDRYCAKIILTRNPVDSFTSLKIAAKTNQWMISDAAHRKHAKIHFDLEEYAEYLAERSAYYANITKALEMSGQPSFEIGYDELNDLDRINQLAAFIGAREVKTALDEPIKRQNPQGLAEKISNFQEVKKALNLSATGTADPLVKLPKKATGTDLSRIYFCKQIPLGFAPVPAVPDGGIRQWQMFHDHNMAKNGFTRQRFDEWKASRPNAVFFSVVQHPVRRAYHVFMQKIFPTVPQGYLAIRQQLESRFGLLLPEGEITPATPRAVLEDSGYGLEAHRIAFKQFLVFASGNLAGETDIRQDGKWQLQSEIIRRYRVLHPVAHVFKSEQLQADLSYLENRLGLKPYFGWKDEAEPVFSFALSDIYDAEVEALTQAAYGQDYNEFSYQPWRG